MKHSLRLATLTCFASLIGCATLPDEEIDSVEQPALVDPGTSPTPIPNPQPNPCLSDVADLTVTLPTPLLSSNYTQNTAASEPGGLYACDYHVIEFRNVDTLRQYTGFNSVSVGTVDHPGLTEADCAASVFSGWLSAYHPPVNGAAGWWETIRSLPAQHAVWITYQGGASCVFDPSHGNLHYFSTTSLSGVTRLRLGSRFKVRHNGVWIRRPVQSTALFYPPS